MRLACVAAMVLACGCPHGGTPHTDQAPSVQEVVDRLAKAREALTSFRSDSTMDYWLAGQRAKGEVLVMGSAGAKVRFAALSPAGGSTIAEMACDGANFVYVDYQNNCALSGPCDASSIAQFFHIELAPDDFLHLAVGTLPVITNPTGKVKWSGDYEKVELTGADGAQKITIDDRGGRLDVIDSELVGSDGKVRWSVANTDFTNVKDEAGAEHRVPGKTRFKSPGNQQDLLVEWGTDQRAVNLAIAPDKFKLDAPAGLPTCGQKTPATPTPAPTPTKSPPAAAKP